MVFLLMTLIFCAAIAFYLGVTQPLMTLERFFIFESEASLIQIVAGLWHDQSWPLAVLIGFFSLFFPTVKLGYLAAASVAPSHFLNRPGLSVLATLSKWSMLDVLVVAVVIVATKMNGLAKASVQPGLWYFTVAIVLMALATVIVQRQARQVGSTGNML